MCPKHVLELQYYFWTKLYQYITSSSINPGLDNSKQNNESIAPESNASEQDDIMTIFSTRFRIDFVLKKNRYILSINDRNEERM